MSNFQLEPIKPTNIEFIKATLEAQGIQCVVRREPGGTPLAEEIREVLVVVQIGCGVTFQTCCD